MGFEQKSWERLRGVVGKRWHATRHEDKINLGVPDISFGCNDVQGWIELKAVEKMPEPSVVLRLNCYTAHQKLWLLERGNAGGNCWLLVRVECVWFLFNHLSAQKITNMKFAEFVGAADFIFSDKKLRSCVHLFLSAISSKGQSGTHRLQGSMHPIS